MKRSLLIFFCLVLPVVAAAQNPIVQAHFEPTHGILVGQPVRLIVTVYVPNYFTGSPDFPEFEVENAIVVMPQDRPANSNKEIGTVRYAGISETYVIYPQQAGNLHLPKAELIVSYAETPPKSVTVHIPLPTIGFHADVPSAARDLDYFLPTTSLTMNQTWSSPIKKLHAGDSMERTVTVTAAKMQAMLIPPLPLDAPAGIHAYPDEPIVHDQKTARGDFIYGRRIQSAKYLIQKEGDYTLPSIELKWWNLSTHRLVTSTIPAVHFVAFANPSSVTELPPEPEPAAIVPIKRGSLWSRYRARILIMTSCCSATLFFLLMGWRYLPRIQRRFEIWRERRRHSETTYFHHLQRACVNNDAVQSYVWLLKWLDVAYPDTPLQEALKGTDSPELMSETNDLGEILFANPEQNNPWKGARFGAVLKRLRKSHLAASSNSQYLGDLNPK